MCSYNNFCYKTFYGLKIIIFIFRMIEYFNEDLTKKIKEAKETNNLEKERILKGFSRLYSICLNISKIMNDYEDCEEFDEIRTFFSYVSQIFCNYIDSYIEDKKISLELLETILNCLVYEYAFCGFCINEGKDFLILRKCVLRDEDLDDEILNIPVPITKTDDWYNRLKQINSSRL